MSLWFDLRANRKRLGQCEIRRLDDIDLTRPLKEIKDLVSNYVVLVDDIEVARVRHRYGDGAWALVQAAFVAAELDSR